MAAIEIGVVQRAWLRRRVAAQEALRHRLRWREREEARCQRHGRFTKLARFYNKLLAPEVAPHP